MYLMVIMNLTVGTRVSARRGPFLPLQDGQRRQQRARLYGWVRESVGEKLWIVAWDDGQITREKSAQLAAHLPNAGLPPPEAPSPSVEVGVVNPPSHFGPIIQPAEAAGAPSDGGRATCTIRPLEPRQPQSRMAAQKKLAPTWQLRL